MTWLSKFGWGIFWSLSFLGALLAFRFVPAGFSNGFLPNLDQGLGRALYDGVFVGIRQDFSHIFYHVQDRLTPLLVHMLIAVIAITIVPFQLWRRFRNRHLNWHRWMGRIAVMAVIFSGLGSMRLAVNMDIPVWGQVGFVTGAFVWIGSVLWATWAILQNNVARHQWWMVVAAAMTFGAVMIRLEFPIWRQFLPFPIAYACVAWSSWVLNLVAVALWRLGRGWSRQRRARA